MGVVTVAWRNIDRFQKKIHQAICNDLSSLFHKTHIIHCKKVILGQIGYTLLLVKIKDRVEATQDEPKLGTFENPLPVVIRNYAVIFTKHLGDPALCVVRQWLLNGIRPPAFEASGFDVTTKRYYNKFKRLPISAENLVTIKACEQCFFFNEGYRPKSKVPMQLYDQRNVSNSRYYCDTMGPIRTSAGTKKHILLITRGFSKFATHYHS